MSLLLCCLGMAAIGLPDGALGVAWPSMRVSLGLPQEGLGLVLAATGVGIFGAGLLSGQLIQRLGFIAALPAAAVIAALGLLGEALAPTGWLLCVGALAAGTGFGTLDAGINAMAALRYNARDINWLHGFYGIGATIGPLLMTMAITGSASSWRRGYGILALSTIGVAAILRCPARGSAVGHADWEESSDQSWRDAARHKLLRWQLPLFFVYTGIEVTLGQWNYSVMTESRGVGPGLAGIFTSIYWASLTVGRFACGAIVERVGADRLVRVATIGAILGTALFAAGDGTLGAAGLAVAGVALAPIFPTLVSRAPERLGRGTALHAVGYQISAALAGATALPALAGVLASSFGLAAIGWCATAMAGCLLLLHEVLMARSAN